MINPDSSRRDLGLASGGATVHYLCEKSPHQGFEEHYLEVRQSELRLISDEVLTGLPTIEKNHRHAAEWEMRARSLSRLTDYLRGCGQAGRLLDLGCGNGWMSNALTLEGQFEVFAIDLNERELQQGARVFGANRHLRFIYADIFESPLPEGAFEMLIAASSLQYFPDLRRLLHRAFSLLAPGGEIHILDTPFYHHSQIASAAARSADYYRAAGTPEMSGYYHHHSYDAIDAFDPDYLYDPRRLKSRIMRRVGLQQDAPFPWIRIERQDS